MYNSILFSVFDALSAIDKIDLYGPSFIRDIFKMLGSRHGRQLRDRRILEIPTHRCLTGLLLSLWPIRNRSSQTLSSFHRGLL